jgi:hypothetical protein
MPALRGKTGQSEESEEKDLRETGEGVESGCQQSTETKT